MSVQKYRQDLEEHADPQDAHIFETAMKRIIFNEEFLAVRIGNRVVKITVSGTENKPHDHCLDDEQVMKLISILVCLHSTGSLPPDLGR